MFAQKLSDTSPSNFSPSFAKDQHCLSLDSTTSTKVPSFSSSDNQSNPTSYLKYLNFQSMDKRKKNALLNGISMRLINLKWYHAYVSTTEGDPDFSFREFEIEFLQRTDISKDSEFKSESFVRMEKFRHYSSSKNFVKALTLKEYLLFFILNGEFDPCVLIIASLYTKRALENPKTAKLIKPEGLRVFFGICVLLAFKYTNDQDFWPLKEYCNFLGIKEKTLQKYEKFVAFNILNFQFFVSDEEYQNEKIILETIIRK